MATQLTPHFKSIPLRILMFFGFLALTVSVSVGQENEGAKDPEGDKVEQNAEDEETEKVAEPTLKIGTKAPALDIEHWVADDNGAFLHTTTFEPGTIYVVDFWDVRWAQAVNMLPRLAEIQEKFRNDDVQVISIGLNSLEIVEKLLDQKIPDQKGRDAKTFRDVTEAMCLTSDDDKSVYKDYLEASGRILVPCSFVVGKKGVIEWIGHPKDLEEPLKQLIDDKWDREKYAKVNDEEVAKQMKMAQSQEVLAEALEDFPKAMQQGVDEGLEFLEKALSDPKNELAKPMIAMVRLQLLVGTRNEDGPKALREFADAYTTDEESALELNNYIWTIYERHRDFGDVNDELLEAGLHAARVAIKFHPKSGAINDTVAHYVFVVENDIDEAIEWQKKAVANAEGREADLQPFLDELLEAKEKMKKNGDKSDKSDKSGKKKEKTDF